VSADPQASPEARTFVLVVIGASLPAWEIGFELGAFGTISYRRVLAVFVVATVVLIATFVVDDPALPRGWPARLLLAAPAVAVALDATTQGAHQVVETVLVVAAVLSFPYGVYVVARLLAGDYFMLGRRLQVIAALTVLLVAVGGWYMGEANDRFLVCSDFELLGDYVPPNCHPG
jgi:hypothetical protein